MARPRIIFVNRVYWPSLAATAQLLTDLAEGLAHRGWPVHVIAAGNDAGSRHAVTIHRTGEGDRHGGLISRAGNYWRFIRRVRAELRSIIQPGDVVVAMTDPPMLGAAITAVATKHGARVIHWVQDIYPEIVSAHVGFLARAALLPLRLKRDSAWRNASACVVLGETMARLIGSHGVDRNHIVIAPNWAPRELHHPANADDLAAQRATWELDDKFIVAYSGNLGRVHEFAAILDAAEHLRDRPEFIFLFIGTGARLGEVQSAITSRKLTNVRILPPASRNDLAASLGAADVQLVTLKPEFAAFVYPSKLAGVLAAARPVIFVGQPAGEIATLIEQCDCGISFAPVNGVGLAKMLIRWQADPEHRLGLSRRARIAYEKHFTFESALNQWEDLVEKLPPANHANDTNIR